LKTKTLTPAFPVEYSSILLGDIYLILRRIYSRR